MKIQIYKMLYPVMVMLCPALLSGQVNNSFPKDIEQLYLNEHYAALAGPGLGYLAYLDHNNDRPPEKLIRMAYFLAWAGQGETYRDSLIDQWHDEFRGWPDPNRASNSEQADLFTVKAVIASDINDIKTAVTELKRGLSIRLPQTKIDTAIQADCHQFMGSLLKKQLNYTESLEHYREAIRLNRLINRLNAIPGIILEKTPSTLLSEPDNPNILADLKEALNYFTKTENHDKIAFACNEIGNFYTVKKDFPRAAYWFRSSLNIKLRNNDPGLHYLYNNLSATYSLMNRPDSVIYYMRKALETTPEDLPDKKALYYSNLGAIYGGQNQPDSALNSFTMALKTLYPNESLDNLSFNPNPTNFIPILPTVIANKGNALFELYKNNDDVYLLHQAVSALETAINQFNNLRALSSMNNKLLFIQNSREYYFLALEVAAELFQVEPTDQNFNLVLQFSQQAKSAVFNEHQRILLARDSLNMDEHLITTDDSLKSKKAELTQILFLLSRNQTPNSDSIHQINAEILRTNREIEILTEEIKIKYPVYIRYTQTPVVARVADLQNALDKNELLIDYTYEDTTLITLLVSKDQVKVANSSLPKEFQTNIRDFLRLLNQDAGSEFSGFIRLGHSFYVSLLSRHQDLIAERDLVIIPDGSIGYLPFDTFVSDSVFPERKHYKALPLLIKEHSFRYLNSYEQLISQTDKKAAQRSEIFAFAPFTSSPYQQDEQYLATLAGSKNEIKAIAQHAEVKMFFDMQATKENFISRIGHPGIIHLATHGLLSSGNPMNNRILFAQSGKYPNLPLFEVINMPVKSRLIVLSACETGTGDLKEGEGIMSLTRGFHYAGTPSLIMSLWPAYDLPSVRIMEEFYLELRKGQKLSKAIQTAKLRYIEESNTVNSHPGYWANYQLSGQDATIPLKGPFSGSWIFLILVPILLVIIILWIRRRNRSSK